MSYYSDVIIMAGLTAAKMLEESFSKDFCPDITGVGQEQKLFIFEGIKWYDDVPTCSEVNNIMSVLDVLDCIEDADLAHSYKYVRLGEEDQDVEERSNSNSNRINFNLPFCIPDWMEELKG